MSLKYLAKNALASWLSSLAAKQTVLAPQKEGRAVIFRPYQTGQEPCLERGTVSPKKAIFPAGEVLLNFQGLKDPANPGQAQLDLAVNLPTAPQVLFACRSCDARGFTVLDHAFLEGKFQDPYYKARRDNTTIVTQTCTSPCNTCFCHWVGGGPTDSTGSDVTFTPLGDQGADGYVLEAHTEKGQALIASLEDAPDKQAAMDEVKAKSQAALAEAPVLTEAPARLKQRFTDTEFWKAMTAKCLSCGACTYMCPTCQCFNITDEGDPLAGRRIRSYDNCMSSLFTRETSGHNSRQDKSLRMRNRVSHKYWYSPEYTKGQFSCTGCGRCIKHCPVSLDIREIVTKAIAE